MKIRVAIIDNNKDYLNNLIDYFNSKYSFEIEPIAFSDVDAAEKATLNNIDIYLIEEQFVDKFEKYDDIKKIILVSSSDIDEYHGKKATGKYQKIENIYKVILDVYSASTKYDFSQKTGDVGAKVVCFTSVCGGVGTTTVSLSYAINKAIKGMKVLYLDLNEISNVSAFLNGEGEYTFSDVQYSIKSKKSNLQ